MKTATLKRYARNEMLCERAPDGRAVYFHSNRCQSFCDYCCNGSRGDEIARRINKLEGRTRAR